MINNNSNDVTDSMSMIRIVGINTDKTRKVSGAYTIYHVYFELSEHPPAAWREIFGREWTNLNAKQEAGIDGKFLFLDCPLEEVETIQLPALKDAVGSTNVAYQQYVREQVLEEEHKADVWKEERKNVEDMSRTLKFQ